MTKLHSYDIASFLDRITARLFLPVSYALMRDCWNQNLYERPSFQELFERLGQMLLEEVEYFDLNKLDESKHYYRVRESKTGETEGEDKGKQ